MESNKQSNNKQITQTTSLSTTAFILLTVMRLGLFVLGGITDKYLLSLQTQNILLAPYQMQLFTCINRLVTISFKILLYLFLKFLHYWLWQNPKNLFHFESPKTHHQWLLIQRLIP